MAAKEPPAVLERGDDLTEMDDAQLLRRAEELSAVAEAARAEGHADHADRATSAGQHIRDFVARRRLAATEAANYARANAPREIETEE